MNKFLNSCLLITLTATIFNFQQVYCQEELISEFMQGNTAKFCTKDLPKSQGLNLCIKFPKSMINSDGNRPHIVQKFRQYAKPETYIIQINMFESEPTYNEINDFFSSSNLIKIANENGTYLSHNTNVKIDGLKAGSVEFKMSSNQLGTDIVTYTLTYYIIYKDYLITLMGSTGGKKEEGESFYSKKFEKAKLLFNLMTNSIVIENQWK